MEKQHKICNKYLNWALLITPPGKLYVGGVKILQTECFGEGELPISGGNLIIEKQNVTVF